MNNILRILVGTVIGAAVGFVVYRYIGCRTGACPLTGNPYIAIVMYALFGAVIAMSR